MIYEVEQGQSLKKEFVANPGHKAGFLLVFLKEKDTNVIIAAGMRETAQKLFIENQIEVVVGAQGLCDNVIQQFIKGQLKSTGSVCTEHVHEDHCEE